MLLSVNDIHVYYGAIHAVKGVSLEVNEGEVVTLIGANGAGKSTLMSVLLPAPLRPMMPKISPSSMRRLTSRSAWMSPPGEG